MKAKAKKINLQIAPGNWSKMQSLVTAFNENPERTAPKMKFTDVVNQAIQEFFPATGETQKKEA